MTPGRRGRLTLRKRRRPCVALTRRELESVSEPYDVIMKRTFHYTEARWADYTRNPTKSNRREPESWIGTALK